MRRLTVVAMALALALLAVAMFAGALLAQTSQEVYPACAPGKARIDATALPQVVEEAKCPVGGRAIVDSGGVGSELPDPGFAIYPEVLLLDGSQQLAVINPADGIFVLEDVGSEASAVDGGTVTTQALRANGCDDSAYNHYSYRVYGTLRWEFNAGSTPNDMSIANVKDALQRAGTNITHVHNPCGIGDGVGAKLAYDGRTSRATDFNPDGTCANRDDFSMTGFGDLPVGWVSAQCPKVRLRDGQDEIVASDIRFNKKDYDWTAKITSSCYRRLDVESVMTHERGHTFGMDHVREDLHPYQTMSIRFNNYCQGSERSLGRGDSVGLNRKYP